MEKTVKVLSYRYDKKLRRSIPDRCKIVEDEDNSAFTMAEIRDIIKASILLSKQD